MWHMSVFKNTNDNHYIQCCILCSFVNNMNTSKNRMAEVYDPHANIRTVREKFRNVGPVLEGIDDDDPIHLAAREMWGAINKDLGEV